MVLTDIEKLLEKYDNGETSLQEEQQLKNYFSKETVPAHLESYQTMFQYFSVTKEEQYTKDVPLKTKTYLYQWISVAAVVAIMFGVYTQFSGPSTIEEQLTDEQLLAYNQTVEGLQYLGIALNKGNEKMKTLNLVASNLNEGTEKMAHIGEFTKTTNKILKTSN
ncbi:MAG: hypothetical protein EX254_00890 [Flavobacteriaceae bacterium]|nr:MAG: hypothetical protein EX254_00890 [Flavobacteriaceae bacterium]